MSAPTEALGLEPNHDRGPGERHDIRPHGTEARARRERRKGGRPCPACLQAENAAHAWRRALAARGVGGLMTDRVRFTPEPVSWHVPPSQRGHLEAAPERGHSHLVRLWLYPDGPADSPASLVLTSTDVRRLCAVLVRQLPAPEVSQ